MEDISPDLATELGISTSHSRMDNGELRYRLIAKDGSTYARTEATASGGWQNSHYHKSVLETYIVQEGWAAFAESHEAGVRWRILRPGDVHTTRPGVPHNVYMSAHAVTHVVKYGGDGQLSDWFADPGLDSLTKHLSEAEILAAPGRDGAVSERSVPRTVPRSAPPPRPS
jgi:mannose-6-phosphate isomerase-like protein (cupin superfamily)